jgi:hypothetical protein
MRRRSHPAPPFVRSVVVVTLGAVLLAACGDGGGERTASMRSGERPATTATTGTPGSSATSDGGSFCDVLASLDAAGAGDEPAAFVEAVERLRPVAPPELVDDLDVLASIADDLAALDENDPESAARALELVLDPRIMEASSALERYALDECGLELGDGDDTTEPTAPGDDTLPFDEPDDGVDDDLLDLEDIDAVKDANEGASWVDKLTTTIISMDVDVQLAADEGAGLTVDEPQVTVEIRSGDRALAGSEAGGACQPR